MDAACARCGGNSPETYFTPPLEWVEYLVEERDITSPDGGLRIPLCHPCKGAVEFLCEYEFLCDSAFFCESEFRSEFEVAPEIDVDDWSPAVDDRRNELLDEFETTAFFETGGQRIH